MILQHAKDMTANFGSKNIKDCVITVPSHFTYHERKALYTAADIAELRVLTLIEENTAAALHYSMDRVYDTPHNVIFYNMGASSVQVTITSFSSYTVKEGGKNKTIGHYEVIGKGWNRSLGGFTFDVKLAELLADRFNVVWNNKKNKGGGEAKDVRNFIRPMTRLRNEAVKVKEVLSANNEYPVKLEQLHDDTDLSTKITRADFEAYCADVFASVTEPIEQALRMANISLDSVHAVELLGGGVRMPKVKKLLEYYFKVSKLEVGHHMNGDEAMALGAAFRAANLSTSFKVRKVGQSDINNFGVSIHLETLPSEEEVATGGGFLNFFAKKTAPKAAAPLGDGEAEKKWTKDAEIFPQKLTLSSKLRTVTFPYDKDIACKIEYTNPDALPAGTDSTIALFNITGITKFATDALQKNASVPKVHLSFSLDSDGVVSLVKAEATAEVYIPPASEADAAAVNSTASAESNSTASNSTATNSTSKDKKAKADDKKSKDAAKTDNILRKTLSVTENFSATNPSQWSHQNIVEARLRLRALQLADDARKAKEAALNELEAYIYKVRLGFQLEFTLCYY